MIKLASVILSAALTLAGGSASALGVISFEAPVQNGGSNAYTYDPTVAGMTFTGAAGVQANGSAWQFNNAPDGNQTAFLQNTSSNANAEIDIAVTGLTPGFDYTVSYRRRHAAGKRPLGIALHGVVQWRHPPERHAGVHRMALRGHAELHRAALRRRHIGVQGRGIHRRRLQRGDRRRPHSHAGAFKLGLDDRRFRRDGRRAAIPRAGRDCRLRFDLDRAGGHVRRGSDGRAVALCACVGGGKSGLHGDKAAGNARRGRPQG